MVSRGRGQMDGKFPKLQSMKNLQSELQIFIVIKIHIILWLEIVTIFCSLTDTLMNQVNDISLVIKISAVYLEKVTRKLCLLTFQ